MQLGNIILISIIAIFVCRIIIACMGKEAKSGWVTAGSVFGILALLTSWSTINSARNMSGTGASRAIASGITLLFGGGIGVILLVISGVCMFVGLMVAISRKSEMSAGNAVPTEGMTEETGMEDNPDSMMSRTIEDDYQEEGSDLSGQAFRPGEGSANIENLMDRGHLCLEDEDFKGAERFFERVLDQNARYAPAYIGKLLAKLKLRKEEHLSQTLYPFEQMPEWDKAYRFATDEEKKKYDDYVAQAEVVRHDYEKKKAYDEWVDAFHKTTDIDGLIRIKKGLESFGDYEDAKEYVSKCEQAIACKQKKKARAGKAAWAVVVLIALAIGGYFLYTLVLGPMFKYNNAEKLLADKKYTDAQIAFMELGDYKDASERINEPLYVQGKDLEAAGDIDGAISAYAKSGHFKDADDRICALYYNRAVEQMTAGNYNSASNDFTSAAKYVSNTTPAQYKDAESRIYEPFYAQGVVNLGEGKEDEAIKAFTAANGFKDAKAQICSVYYNRAVREMNAGEYDAASVDFSTAATYVDDATPEDIKDAAQRVKEPYYKQAVSLVGEKKISEAMEVFSKADGFSDAKEQYIKLCLEEAARLKSEANVDQAINWLQEHAIYQEITDQYVAEVRKAGTAAMNNKDYDSAISYFSMLEDDEIQDLILECHYHLAEKKEEENDPEAAIEEYKKAGGYSDAAERVVSVCVDEANRLKAEDKTEEAIEWLSSYTSNTSIKAEYQETVYAYAKGLLETKDYDKAYGLFNLIKGYSDVNSLLESNPHLVRAQRRKWIDTPIGGTITFGRYEQDNHSNNGKEPIQWRVLAKDGNKMLVITKLVIESHYFHTKTAFRTWDKSSVRAWLNSNFMNEAFTSEEQGAIATTLVTADLNPNVRSADPGMDTQDKLFLLSSVEANKYFSSDKDMEADCSTYAAYQGASWLGKTLWMTRTPCLGTVAPACVFSDTGVQDTDVLYSAFYMSPTGVRPAMWLDFSSSYFMDADSVESITDSTQAPREGGYEGL